MSIYFWICQALAKPLRKQLYQALVSKHLLASTIVSGFDDCIWDGSPGGAGQKQLKNKGYIVIHGLEGTMHCSMEDNGRNV